MNLTITMVYLDLQSTNTLDPLTLWAAGTFTVLARQVSCWRESIV
jgi:hypothetical protein